MYEYYYTAARVQIITDGEVSQADIVEIANGMNVLCGNLAKIEAKTVSN